MKYTAIKPQEVKEPGLYWYSRDGEPKGFAEVMECHGAPGAFGFRPLGNIAWIATDSAAAKGEFSGPVPNTPRANAPGYVCDVGPETLAVIMLPIALDRMLKVLAAFPDGFIRGGEKIMFIERKPE